MVGGIIPPEDVLGTCGYVIFLCSIAKKKVADGTKVAGQQTLKWGDYPGLDLYVITRVLQGGRGGAEEEAEPKR